MREAASMRSKDRSRDFNDGVNRGGDDDFEIEFLREFIFFFFSSILFFNNILLGIIF